jgi:hypothetical protein
MSQIRYGILECYALKLVSLEGYFASFSSGNLLTYGNPDIKLAAFAEFIAGTVPEYSQWWG